MDASVLEAYLRRGLSLERIMECARRGGKDFGLADRGLTRSLDVVRREAAKCILLCANCHSEVEAGIVKTA